ncbi:MAG: gliding motility-associated C-terminal domain-containing protein, partial [Flavobacteriales bacterium]|nr:gliding motility-associated C-terminal domain-containing protein [Flavobacteriales bacterium]
ALSSAQAGGTWSGPSPVVGGLFDPATMSAGAYTYTVAGMSPCPDDQSVVTVTVVSEPDPGGPGFLTVCESDGLQDLFSMLEGSPDQGGSWTAPNGSASDGQFDPSTMSAGVYTYTIAVPPPCMSVSSTVTVDVINAPDAGTDGAATLCFSNAAQDLFNHLGGTPEAGGIWTTNAGTTFDGSFDPATDVPGIFTYTVAGSAPCPADAAQVTIAVTQLPNPGTDGLLNLCVASDPVELFPVLGGADTGGTWNGPDGAASGTFTPNLSTPGAYMYTVAGIAPCPSASATITVHVLSDVDAGIDGALTICGDHDPVDLFEQLGGTPDAGGGWFAPNGAPMNGSFDPMSSAEGAYQYIVFVPAPCLNDTSTVTMSVVVPPDAGADGAATLCNNNAAIALFGVLNGTPDAGGNWTGPSMVDDGLFDPHLDDPGGYTYTVAATAPCLDASASVIIDVNPLPDAGENGSITLCPEAAPIALFSLLGGTPMPGGTWSGPGGQPSDGTFDPATSAQGVYTYTVFGTQPCPNAMASSTATVFLIAPPDAGPDAVTCTLTYELSATGNWASGSWSGPAGISFAEPDSPNSIVMASSGGAYTLSWNVISTDGCSTQDEVTITFTDAIVPVVAVTDAICNAACDGTATVQASGGNGAYAYQWSAGINGNGASVGGLCAGQYAITVLDVNGCSGSSPFSIGEPEVLVIDLVSATNETCPDDCDGTLTVSDPEGALYSLNGGAFVSDPVFTGLCPGAYAVTMLNANGCAANGGAVVQPAAPVIAGFTYAPETLLVTAPTAQFTNASSPNAVAFSWDFAGLGSSNEASPAFTFPGGLGDQYQVCLTAFDANGCPDTYCSPIEVLDALVVWVPNTFTPNEDGVNEGFKPIFNLPWAVRDYEFMIFDRWGELIHQTAVVDESWDGFYQNDIVKTEVYVWKLKCYDKLTNELIERIGHVTVLK